MELPVGRKKRRHVQKSDEQMAFEERVRNIQMGINLIESNSKDCLIVFSGWDGNYGHHYSTRTYALGASGVIQEKVRKLVRDEE